MGFSFRLDRKSHEESEEIPTLDFSGNDNPPIPTEIEDNANDIRPTEDSAEKPAESEEAEQAPNEPMVLRTENLVKKYGKRTVVNHVSIDVKQGEIVGLLGPNGAGKTTTFYMTVGLITPNEGQIYLNEQNITKFPVYKRAQNGIGYLAQEPSVFRKLSVEDNIKAVLQMTKTSKEYQREKLESLIAEFRLEKVRKNLGDQLSGGERRRTEIARCLAIDPKFIMLDEPFAGVDPIAVEDIQYIVYRLKEKNIGILITDHNAPETLSITDRAYLLFEGKILFQGSSEELAENPTVREKYLGRNFIFHRKKFE
jgi:lipopolysaccharide export system ATP-binding protein